jgi:hypothetical protein
VSPYSSSYSTEINVQISIPSFQKFQYVTPILLQLKNAWVQYLAIFIPVFIVIYLIMRFLFKYQIFDTAVNNDLPAVIKGKYA